jgi:hypothetical protein
MSSDVRAQHVYTISGVRVEFPAKAYPSQIAMMDKVRADASYNMAQLLLFLIIGSV